MNTVINIIIVSYIRIMGGPQTTNVIYYLTTIPSNDWIMSLQLALTEKLSTM